MGLTTLISLPNSRFVRAAALIILALTGLVFASSAPPSPAAANLSPLVSADSPLFPPKGSLAPFIAGDEKWAPGFGVRGVNGTVEALAVDDGGNVYVGGRLSMAGNLPVRNVAKWDGTNWSALAYGLDEEAISLAWDSVHGWLYAGGDFMNICLNADCSLKKPSRGIARWDPSGGGSWHALDYGLNGRVSALALDTIGNLYAGGSFPTICYSPDCSAGDPANNIAEWNPAGAGVWSALSSTGGIGVSGGDVYAMAWWNAPFIGEVLVVGGAFTNAGGTAMNRLAYWTPATNTWSSFLSGVDGIVYTLAVDWSTSSVVVGGSFPDVCQPGAVPPACGTPTRVNNIALLFPAAYYWGPLNNGVSGYVYTVSIDNIHKSVYVGGYVPGYCNQLSCEYGNYTPTSFVARWDYPAWPTTSWTTLGQGTDDAVKALAWNQAAGLLYAGGFFKQAGDEPTSAVAKWDGSAWSSVGTGDGVGGFVNALAADAHGRVYAGGTFRSIGNVFVNRIAVWNDKTNTWSALSYGVSGDVDAMALDASGNLYVGGMFLYLCGNAECSVNGPQVNGIAKWTPNPSGTGTWSALGVGVYPGIHALAFDHINNLYAGGSFSLRCDNSDCSSQVPSNAAAVWSGSNWSNVGLGVNYTIRALAVDKDNNLYAGGDFYRLCTDQICQNGPTANHIARWAPASGGGGTWSPIGNGVDRSVYGLVVDRNNILFAGGTFAFICSSPACTNNTQVASGIAKWNGAWSSVGNGLKGAVRVLGLDEWNQLFAGGFLDALCADSDCYGASTTVNNIARWDGATWNALGSGVGPMPGAYVNALSYSHGTLTVGGYFSTAGDKVSGDFARYIYGKYSYAPIMLR